MKNNLKELISNWNSSDSITERENISESIISQAVAYIECRYLLNSKYQHDKDWPDWGYNGPKRGSWTMDDDPTLLNYYDSWRYGGESHAGFRIKPEEIDSFDPVEYEKNLVNIKTKRLEAEIVRAENEVVKAKKNLDDFFNGK